MYMYPWERQKIAVPRRGSEKGGSEKIQNKLRQPGKRAPRTQARRAILQRWLRTCMPTLIFRSKEKEEGVRL